MSAHMHTPSRAKASGVGVRLPWWALALPVLAFCALLMLIAGPGDAHAATGEPAVGAFIQRVQQALAG
ncbi:hypothetical protein OHS70_29190 [Streptomyces sp. NBC_00390]|uniref:hypothetical protein n=1 Tax=unclassified Streptomyces TaxID=2593676 RepID=UPI002E1F563A